jgi:hypothetical protein
VDRSAWFLAPGRFWFLREVVILRGERIELDDPAAKRGPALTNVLLQTRRRICMWRLN